MTSIAWSTSTIPSSDGPMTMPATISSTTEGSRTRGNRPSTKGAAKATATTMSRSVREGMPSGPVGGPPRYARAVGEGRAPATIWGPASVSTNVSSAFAPVTDGFQAKAWPGSITWSLSGVAISSREP